MEARLHKLGARREEAVAHVNKDLQVHLDHQDAMGVQVLLVVRAIQDHQAEMEPCCLLLHQNHLVRNARYKKMKFFYKKRELNIRSFFSQGHQVQQVHQDQKVYQVLKATQDHQARTASLVVPDHRVRKVRQANLANLVIRGRLVIQAKCSMEHRQV